MHVSTACIGHCDLRPSATPLTQVGYGSWSPGQHGVDVGQRDWVLEDVRAKLRVLVSTPVVVTRSHRRGRIARSCRGSSGGFLGSRQQLLPVIVHPEAEEMHIACVSLWSSALQSLCHAVIAWKARSLSERLVLIEG